MTFESNGMKVIQPLDPYQGPWYSDPTYENMEQDSLDQLYTMIVGKLEYYINAIADGSISWQIIQSADEDSEVAWDNWKQGRYAKFSRHCTIVRAVRWIRMGTRECPTYDGTLYLHIFLINM